MKPISEMTITELLTLREFLVKMSGLSDCVHLVNNFITDKGKKALKAIEAIDELILNQTYY